MTLHTTKDFSLFIGNQETSIYPEVLRKETSTSILQQAPFTLLKNKLGLSHLVFQHQVHGTDGTLITSTNTPLLTNPLFSQDGDFLITNQPHIGIGVLTADCLPLVFINQEKKIVGIAHAGWRGTVANIALEVLKAFRENFESSSQDISVFFGPAAKVCCYKVDEPFRTALSHNTLAQAMFKNVGSQLFFDNTEYNKELLLKAGIAQEALFFQYHECTLCTTSYCSHRRSGGDKRRQMTVISLK